MVTEQATRHKKWYPKAKKFDRVQVPLVHMTGFLENGQRVIILDGHVRPFMLAEKREKPKKSDRLERKAYKKFFNRKYNLPKKIFDISNSPIKIELVERTFKGKKFNWWKLYGTNPSVDIREWRGILESYDVDAEECDIYYDQVYMKTTGIVPSAWNRIRGKIKRVREHDYDEDYLVYRVVEFDSVEVDEHSDYPELRHAVFDIEGDRPILTIFYAVEKDNGKVKAYRLKNIDMDFEGEKKLLEAFGNAVAESPYDVLHQYNGFAYDWLRITDACEDHNVHLPFGVDGSSPRETQYHTFQIRGRPTIDQYGFAFTIKSKRKTLYAVHQKMREEGKVQRRVYYTIERGSIYNLPWDEIEKHCMSDIKCCMDIGKYSIDYLFYMSKICGIPIDQAGYVSMNVNLEGLLMRIATTDKELIARRGTFTDEITRANLMGADVFEPQRWFAEWVVVFDFASMYPNIMSDYNISYETFIAEPKANEKYFKVEDTDNNITYHFTKKKVGFFTKAVRHILEKIAEAKKLFKEVSFEKYGGAVQAIKTLGRSLYGYLKYKGARWANAWAARAVTASGRNRVRGARDFTEKKYPEIEVTYGDTDSIFLTVPKKYYNYEFCNKFSEEASGTIGADLAIDKFLQRLFFCEVSGGGRYAKKKYIYLDDKGDVGFTGFAVARGDWAPIAVQVQRVVAEKVLKTEDVVEGVEHAISYVNFVIHNIKKFPTESFVFTKGVKSLENYGTDQMLPHVCVARRDPDNFIAEDGKVSYVVCNYDAGRRIWGGDFREIQSCRTLHPSEMESPEEVDYTFYRYNQIVKLAGEIINMFLKHYNITSDFDYYIPENEIYSL